MRVFISSVRGGLEAERDALPGLVKAIGFEPVRFEDFTAQGVPSRQACLDGVDSSSVYLLILGPKYGTVFPETGQSATHDEFVRAQTRGLHRLVFVKAGVEMEPEQAAFVKHVEDYGSGLFREAFTDVTDLQTKVAAALRLLASQPRNLTFEPLAQPPTVTWKQDWEDLNYGRSELGSTAEVHVLPLEPAPIPSRVLRTFPAHLAAVLRNSGVVPVQVGLAQRQDADAALVEVPDTRRREMDAVASRAIRGLRVAKNGQISVWWELPSDSIAILQEADLTDAIAQALRLAGAVGITDQGRYAVAAGISGRMVSVVDGPMPTTSRRQVSMPMFGGDNPTRVLPDESVSATAFDTGATECAHNVATALIGEFQRRR
jgi:hypothetical protein